MLEFDQYIWGNLQGESVKLHVMFFTALYCTFWGMLIGFRKS